MITLSCISWHLAMYCLLGQTELPKECQCMRLGSGIRSISFSEDGKTCIAALLLEKNVILTRKTTGWQIKEYCASPKTLYETCFYQQSVLALVDSNSLYVIDLKKKPLVARKTRSLNSREIFGFAVSRTGLIAIAGGDDPVVSIWSFSEGKFNPIEKSESKGRNPVLVAFDESGDHVATFLFDLKEKTASLESWPVGKNSQKTSTVLRGLARDASSPWFDASSLWFDHGRSEIVISGTQAIEPAEKANSFLTVRVDTRTGKCKTTVLYSDKSLRGIFTYAVSPSGTLAALTVGDDSIVVLDTRSGKIRKEWNHCSEDDLCAIAIAPDESTIAIGDREGALRFIDLKRETKK